MNNYDYCAHTARALFSGRKEIRILDYGCGAGHIVQRLLRDGFDAWGCDVFYDGGNYATQVVDGLLDLKVQRMIDGRIPFEDRSFDLVISNQVLEHVADLDAVLAEMDRVLKPGGYGLHMFPDKGVWREGHCEIPFLHWFAKNDFTTRPAYAWLLRSTGFGLNTGGKSKMQWARDMCKWLDDWTYYRPYHQIRDTFRKRFDPLQHREADWLATRYPRAQALPHGLRSFITRKWAGMIFLCRKPV